MGRMADLDAELHELPDEAKDFMQGFYRGRAEGVLIGQEEGAAMERERIIKWVLDNRRKFEIADETFIYRDSFRSEDLIAFIKGENN